MYLPVIGAHRTVPQVSARRSLQTEDVAAVETGRLLGHLDGAHVVGAETANLVRKENKETMPSPFGTLGAYMEETGAVNVVRIVVVNIAESACMSPAENNRTSCSLKKTQSNQFPVFGTGAEKTVTLEHLQEMTRFVALSDTHLNGATAQLVVQFHRVDGRGGLLVLAAFRTLSAIANHPSFSVCNE